MDSEYSYLAGLFDGEGYITISLIPRRTGRMFARMEIGLAMSRCEPIYTLLTAFGGTTWRGRSASGNPSWRWIACGQESQKAFLAAVGPLLRVKKREAEVAIAFLEAAGHNERDQIGRLIQARLKDVLTEERKSAQATAEARFLEETTSKEGTLR